MIFGASDWLERWRVRPPLPYQPIETNQDGSIKSVLNVGGSMGVERYVPRDKSQGIVELETISFERDEGGQPEALMGVEEDESLSSDGE